MSHCARIKEKRRKDRRWWMRTRRVVFQCGVNFRQQKQWPLMLLCRHSPPTLEQINAERRRNRLPPLSRDKKMHWRIPESTVVHIDEVDGGSRGNV